MIRRPLPRRIALLLALLSVVSLVLIYSYLSYAQHLKNPTDTTIPGWGQMYRGVLKMLTPDRAGDRWLVVDSIATAERLFLGLGLGVAVSVLVGILMGTIEAFEAFLSPIMSLAAKVVPTAALAVFFIMVGTDLEMYVTMIVFGISPQLSMTVFLAAKSVPGEMIDKAYTLGASHAEVIFGVVFRQVLPQMIDAIRLSIGPAMVYLIAAELIVGDVGFGYRIRLLSRRLDMDVVYPYLVLLALFGFTIDYGLRWLRDWSAPWYRDSH